MNLADDLYELKSSVLDLNDKFDLYLYQYNMEPSLIKSEEEEDSSFDESNSKSSEFTLRNAFLRKVTREDRSSM
jgi:hypothetical protein